MPTSCRWPGRMRRAGRFARTRCGRVGRPRVSCSRPAPDAARESTESQPGGESRPPESQAQGDTGEGGRRRRRRGGRGGDGGDRPDRGDRAPRESFAPEASAESFAAQATSQPASEPAPMRERVRDEPRHEEPRHAEPVVEHTPAVPPAAKRAGPPPDRTVRTGCAPEVREPPGPTSRAAAAS